MAAFRGIQPDANQPMLVLVEQGQRFIERLERIFFRQMAQETENQLARQTASLAFGQRAFDTRDRRSDRYAAFGVCLRVEENFGVRDMIGERAFDVRHRHVVEIALVQQHARARVVDVEERLQVGERVGRAQRFNGVVRERHAVAFREFEDQFSGSSRTFTM